MNAHISAIALPVIMLILITGVVWIALSGMDFILALTVNRHRNADAPQPSTQAPTALVKDDPQP
ncbi:hypothetical protein ABT272_31275 [Streptomyces sp900105245]|uniref:Uncharacterized protein n=1 Tax=Streptomyces sp. 900105245 TaxID=3154379 RepID=A0ABV1UEM9_9ACTN